MDDIKQSEVLPKMAPPDSTEAAAGTGSSAPARACLSKPERWVEEHGDYLFKYALLRLRDVAKAEDAVQETFLAALKGGKSFAGRSAEKTWLVGIMKNKISDHYRKTGREISFTDLEFYQDEESDRFVSEGSFKGGWIHELGPRWSGRRSPAPAWIIRLSGKHFTIVPASCPGTSAQRFVCERWTTLTPRRFAEC